MTVLGRDEKDKKTRRVIKINSPSSTEAQRESEKVIGEGDVVIDISRHVDFSTQCSYPRKVKRDR